MATPITTTPSPTCAKIIEEITKIYKSLPPRPSILEIEASISVIKTVETEEKIELDEISKKEVAPEEDVPTELYSVLQQVRKGMVLFQSKEKKKQAVQLIELDKTYQDFDGLIQKATELISGITQVGKITSFEDPTGEIEKKDEILKYGLVTSCEKTTASSSGLDLFLSKISTFCLLVNYGGCVSIAYVVSCPSGAICCWFYFDIVLFCCSYCP